MTQILPFVGPDDSLDPEALKAFDIAYDLAISNLRNEGGVPRVVREVVAARIIKAGRNGERDPDRLFKLALRGIFN